MTMIQKKSNSTRQQQPQQKNPINEDTTDDQQRKEQINLYDDDESTIQQEADHLRKSDPDLLLEESATTTNRIDVVSSSTNDGILTKQQQQQQQQQKTFTSEEHKPVVTSLISTDGNKKETVPVVKYPYVFIPLDMGGDTGRTYLPSAASKKLIEKEVPLSSLLRMTTLFYENAYQDTTLDTFIRSHSDPHPDRFAKWIHQKLSSSNLWDKDREQRLRTHHHHHNNKKQQQQQQHGGTFVVHDRSSAHAAAWYSSKRSSEKRGEHFHFDDCRIWMRIHFWALRESGLFECSPTFVDYYVRFIGHFIRVYETNAPIFTRESLRWSANPKNIVQYIKNGRRMTDVIGFSYQKAKKQLPIDEAYDTVYPYQKEENYKQE